MLAGRGVVALDDEIFGVEQLEGVGSLLDPGDATQSTRGVGDAKLLGCIRHSRCDGKAQTRLRGIDGVVPLDDAGCFPWVLLRMARRKRVTVVLWRCARPGMRRAIARG